MASYVTSDWVLLSDVLRTAENPERILDGIADGKIKATVPTKKRPGHFPVPTALWNMPGQQQRRAWALRTGQVAWRDPGEISRYWNGLTEDFGGPISIKRADLEALLRPLEQPAERLPVRRPSQNVANAWLEAHHTEVIATRRYPPSEAEAFAVARMLPAPISRKQIRDARAELASRATHLIMEDGETAEDFQVRTNQAAPPVSE